MERKRNRCLEMAGILVIAVLVIATMMAGVSMGLSPLENEENEEDEYEVEEDDLLFSDFVVPDEVEQNDTFELSVDVNYTIEEEETEGTFGNETNDEINVTVDFLIDDIVVANDTVEEMEDGDVETLSHVADADYEVGEYNVSFEYEDSMETTHELYNTTIEVVEVLELEISSGDESDYYTINVDFGEDEELYEATDIEFETVDPWFFSERVVMTMTFDADEDDNISGDFTVDIVDEEEEENMTFDDVGRSFSDVMVTTLVDDDSDLVLDDWETDDLSISSGSVLEVEVEDLEDLEEIVLYVNPSFGQYLSAVWASWGIFTMECTYKPLVSL